MTYLLKYKIIDFCLICFLYSVKAVVACDCALIPIEDAIKESSVVFSGKVVGFEYCKGIPNWFMGMEAKRIGKPIDYETLVVKVEVEQWWKGNAPTRIFLLTESTRNAEEGTETVSSCEYIFRQGEKYLIFATGKENEYRTSNCSRTRELTQAEKDLKFLGEGKKPLEGKDKQTKPLETNDKPLLSLSACDRNSEFSSQQLKEVSVPKDFWFDWKIYHPNTRIDAPGQRWF